MMTGIFARLPSPWALRGWSDGQRALVNVATGAQRDLSPAWYHVAASCDGRTDLDSAAFTPYHRTILDKLIELGLAEPCAPGDGPDGDRLFREAPNPRISGIHWSVTGRCNLRCRHCFIEAPSARYGELPLAAMLDLVRQFGHANVPKVVLTGGEPLVRADLPEIVGALADAGVAVCAVYTNGHLVDRGVLGIFRGPGSSPIFQVSLDGVGFHDDMRGVPGSEERVVRAIRLLRDEGFRVAVSTSVDRAALGCLGRTQELLEGFDIESWGISVPQKTGNWAASGPQPDLEEEARAYEPLVRRWLARGRPYAMHLGGIFHAPAGSGEYPSPDFTPESYDCSACREMPALLPDGTLLPCPGYVGTPLQERMPNLLAEGLSEVWSDSFLRRFTDRRKEELLPANPRCAGCEHFPGCGLGCRAKALTESGDPDAADLQMCRIWSGGLKRRFLEISAGRG